MKALILNTSNDAYSPKDVRITLTAGELRAFLEDYDDETPIILGFDNGYTYGGFLYESFEEYDEYPDDEE